MISLICPGHRRDAASVVLAALLRSCGQAGARMIGPAQWDLLLQAGSGHVFVVIDPLASWTVLLKRTLDCPGSKLIVLGALPQEFAASVGARVSAVETAWREAATCAPAPSNGQSGSALVIEYMGGVGALDSPMRQRPFLRYDFTDEWNNLGYGAVKMDDSIWALAQSACLPPRAVVAQVAERGARLCDYAGLWDAGATSMLWFNRSVGPVDSQEWALVEFFLSGYRFPLLACQPVLKEVPYGWASAVTMRLDCDEDVESARPLHELYRQMEVPFSLALHAKVLEEDSRHHALPREVAAAGGAILSHTATHAPDWGGSYEAALREGVHSAEVIFSATGIAVRYAVSPFHQTPGYARDGLTDAGYVGCIGGIIRNDPDFLMARGGVPPGASAGFVGHSQQCMLHGDCMLDGADPLEIFKEAYEVARRGGAFFGYLDHPFSPRYQYGWRDEASRIQAHRGFIEFLRSHDGVLFANENQAMDFLGYRAGVVVQRSGPRSFDLRPTGDSAWHVAVDYAGQTGLLPREGLIL